MSFKSLNSKAKGKGSSKFSTVHFIRQRFTALVLIPLFIWLVLCIIWLVRSSSPEELILFISHPLNFSLVFIFISFFLYHGYLGIEDIMKDYIHCKILYKILHKLLILICIITYIVSFINFVFYHLLFRYFTGMG